MFLVFPQRLLEEWGQANLKPLWKALILCGSELGFYGLNKSALFSVQFSRSVVSDSLRPHEPQHTRLPCPSPTPGVHPNPCPLSQWCHPAISSSVIPFSSCPQSFSALGSFQISQPCFRWWQLRIFLWYCFYFIKVGPHSFSVIIAILKPICSNPLQYSFLEKPMGGEACWATVHGVTKSWTQLSNFTFTLWWLRQ